MITTPYEAWNFKKPELSHIRIFGSSAFVHIDKQFRQKLDKKARKLILVRYQKESSNYRLWDPQSNKIIISRDVIFNKDEKQVTEKAAEISQRVCLTQDGKSTEEIASELNQSEDNLERRTVNSPELETESSSDSDAVSLTPERYSRDPPERHLRDCAAIHPPKRYELNFTQHNPPETFREAVIGQDFVFWKEAIEEELLAHKINKT